MCVVFVYKADRQDRQKPSKETVQKDEKNKQHQNMTQEKTYIKKTQYEEKTRNRQMKHDGKKQK